ncbi:type IA DNA topoisomerase [Streptococcus dentasini]
MRTVILTEKSDQRKAYAKALGQATHKGAVSIVKSSPFFEGEVRLIAPEGHLFEYPLPQDNWDLSKLPILNISFKDLQLKKDKRSRDLFKQISQEVQAADQVIIGTDADREGERIAYTILTHIPAGLDKVSKRLWVHSMSSDGIKEAFQQLQAPEETYNYFLEAEARSQSDWLVGMNLSPFTTLKLRRGKGSALSVGRVQTPIVRLICENDLAIQNFQPQPYYKLDLQDMVHQVTFTYKDPLVTSEEALTLLRGLEPASRVVGIKGKTVTKLAPDLFSYSSLTALASRRFGFRADETLKYLESLYLKGYISYPRNQDVTHITFKEFDYLKSLVADYQNFIDCHFEVAHPEPREAYVDPKQVESHYAIIPTQKLPDLGGLSSAEHLIYQAIVKRSLLMFAPDYSYETTQVTLLNAGLEFKTSGYRILEEGWRGLMEKKVKRDHLLPDYQLDSLIPTKAVVRSEITKPPRRLTESLLMGKVLPSYGLGTSATRAAMLKKIQEAGYVQLDKQTGQFYPTQKGYLLISALQDNDFSDPTTTAGWESFLEQIGKGELSPGEFVDGIKEKLTQQMTRKGGLYGR